MPIRQAAPEGQTLGPENTAVKRALSSNDEQPTLCGEAGSVTVAPNSNAPPIAVNTEDLPRGATIDRYLVLSRLGAGGMGVVYAAYDPELGRNIAIKPSWRWNFSTAARSATG